MDDFWQRLDSSVGWSIPNVEGVSASGHTALTFCLRHAPHFVPELLKRGASVAHVGPSGYPPLFCACFYAPLHLKALLEHGADPLALSPQGENFIDFAVRSSPKAVEVLLAHGAHVYALHHRYYDPDWNDKIPPAVKEVFAAHIAQTKAQLINGTGQFSAAHTTRKKSSSSL